MLLLRKGDYLPTVALVQSVLNLESARLTGLTVDVTGQFDDATETMVTMFQQKLGLTPDGVVGPETWNRLRISRRLQVIDHVDAADDYHDSGSYVGYEWDLERVGARPIVSYHESGGLMVVADRIMRANTNNRVVLLRFHGHGGPGSMAVTVGRGGEEYGGSRFSLHHRDWREIDDHFQPLGGIFHPLGSVELHGCNVAGDDYAPDGRRITSSSGVGVGLYLLQRLAQLWGVPVTASPQSQYSHGTKILPFEGRTVTVCPDGIEDIGQWAQGKQV